MELRPETVRKLREWREGERGICRFVVDNFGVDPDPWQEQALQLFASPRADDRRIALQACVGPGKSAVLAWCGWWFLSVQGEKGEHPNGLCTAVTGDNLKGNLWKEYSKWQQRSPYLREAFEWTTKAIFQRGKHASTWRLEARSWPKTADADQQGQTFSGLHAKYVLVQVDESGNIPPPVLRAGEQALAGAVFGKIMQAGNPTSRQGMLYQAAYTLAHQWRVVVITGDPHDPHAWVHGPRVQAQHTSDDGSCVCARCWAAQQIETYGRENPWILSQILGRFPPTDINSLYNTDDIDAAVKRTVRPEEYDWYQKRLGVDVARFGDDRTVIAPRQGLYLYKLIVMRNAPTTDIAARVAKIWNGWGEREALVFVDDTGHWGHGVLDQLDVTGIPNVPLIYNAKANHPRYKNRRSEFYMESAKWMKRGRIPNDRELIAELSEITYTFDNGQFLIEPKEQIKKRVGKSPDKADAFAETFAIPDMPKATDPLHGHANRRARTMDDPQGRDTDRVRAGRALTLDDLEELPQ